MLNQDELKRTLHYDPETGVFTRHFKNGKVKRAGSVGVDHQRVITIKGKTYQARRLAWLYCYGVYPKFAVYHKNRKGDDDRITNLAGGLKGAHLRANY